MIPNYGNGVYPEFLAHITPDVPLYVSHSADGRHHFGALGPNYAGRPVSHAVVALWLDNEIVESIKHPTGKSGDWYGLTELGLRCASRQVPDAELEQLNWQAVEANWRLSKRTSLAETNTDESKAVEGALFSPGGTCQLCQQKMEPFGQISHAKSHVAKGHPVVIEEVGKKKVARMVGPAPAVDPEAPAPAKLKVTAAPKSAVKSQPGDLIDDDGWCQLCKVGDTLIGGKMATKQLSVFGWISHAKTHINAGDPVEVIDRDKKKIAVLKGKN